MIPDPSLIKLKCCTPEEARELIERIRKLDLKVTTVEALKDALLPLFIGYQCKAPIFDPGLKLFRAHKRNEKSTTVRALSYPPAEYVTKPQRANGEGRPKFYCSSFRNTIFFEIRAEPGDLVTLSHWRTTAHLTVNPVGYSKEVFERTGSTREVPAYAHTDFVVDAQHKLIQDFFREEFTRVVPDGSDHEYRLAAAIAEKHVGGPHLHGVMYPTMAQAANAENFAIDPVFADANIQFLYAEIYRIDSREGFSCGATRIDAARADATGALTWSGEQVRWLVPLRGTLKMVEEGGDWTARDVFGNEVLPAFGPPAAKPEPGRVVTLPSLALPPSPH
jgi:hypothetical protein